MAVLASVVILVLSLVAAAFYSSVLDRSPIDPVPVYLPPFPKARGVYAPNALLHQVEKLGKGSLPKPEDAALDPTGQFLYISTSDGWIKKLHLATGEVEDWKHVGGSPLGLVVGNHGEVVVCEPSSGGLLNVTEAGVEVLTTEAEGVKFKLPDEAVVTKEGLIIFTDASSKFGMNVFWLDNLEGKAHGRLLVYNPKDKSTRVLLKNLYFPNGVALSKTEDSVIFCETTLARCSKYFLDGEKKGETEIFIDNLPGFPDNVHCNGDGNFLMGLIGSRDAMSDLVVKVPFITRLMGAYPFVFHKLNKGPKMGRVLVVDEKGTPIKMYMDPTGEAIGYVTGAIEVDGYLYFTGLRDDFIGRTKVQ